MIKKIVFTLFAALCLFVAYYGYYLLYWSTEVTNLSAQKITQVTVNLPGEEVVLTDIEPLSSVHVTHRAADADGGYHYHITFASGASVEGGCGYVTPGLFDEKLTLIVNSPLQISCEFTP
ncbi:hypothetical protein N9W21_07870 [Shewanella sp.]|nr:hypothetical protein [Shewanella sp.]